ncbi:MULTISPECIES: Asp-tRNA(Asn)/Glu-tRNA(Gln) amidotransferase subunit GatC [unclassified Helicobacter]|uniref:Asp-tRNA(Asn)/Glu-tRNA(Gln) amidotransferase subunit GatC n=1 Tax=unclassified Helicobacter TaxID=2593540 RepID=UPI00131597E4|nr:MULTISPECIES: Asp-tRNA(Asn)/Glu-tRNA(Gln) amidotransferase subunit GatC [unclassified Helicobacter]
MEFSDALLQKLEKLAMLEVGQNEREVVKKQLGDILEFVEKIKNVDTQGIEIKNDQHTPLRDDIPHQADIASNVLEHSPQSMQGFFVVPKIIE